MHAHSNRLSSVTPPSQKGLVPNPSHASRSRSHEGRSRSLCPMSAPEGDGSRVTSVLAHLGSMVAVAAILGVVAAGLAIPFATVVGMTAQDVADSVNDLPDELETKALPQRTRILAKDGSTPPTPSAANHTTVPLNDRQRDGEG